MAIRALAGAASAVAGAAIRSLPVHDGHAAAAQPLRRALRGSLLRAR